MAAPPWIWAIIVSLINAWHADRTGERFLHFFGPALSCIVGCIISATTTTTAPRYIAMFLMTSTIPRSPKIPSRSDFPNPDQPPSTAGYASTFVMLAWVSNTITRPRAKKAAAIAIVNASGSIGSIPGSYIWPSKYGPLYVNSFGVEIGIWICANILALTLRFYLKSLNSKLEAEETASVVSNTGAGEAGQIRNNSKGFRYLY